MTDQQPAHKVRLTRAQRFRRLLAATFDPRQIAWRDVSGNWVV